MIKYTFIEALYLMQKGKKVRADSWDDNSYIYLLSDKFYDQDGQCELDEIDYPFSKREWEEYRPKVKVKVKLNDEYEAVVDAHGIKVGCQTFALKKVDELVQAIKKVKEN
jgi:hypothetical protein